jgi:hypothetical protein
MVTKIGVLEASSVFIPGRDQELTPTALVHRLDTRRFCLSTGDARRGGA